MKKSIASALKEIFVFRWKPSKDLVVVLVTWVLVVGAIYSAMNLIGTEVWGGMAYFLVYAVVGALLCGIGIPLCWMVLIRKRPLSSLGITKECLGRSLLLQLFFSLLLFAPVYIKTPLPKFELLFPLVLLSLTIGLFEAIFWRGWVQMRLEESFGIIPGIVVGSLFYAAYHIGYNMPLSEMGFLFIIGIMYATAFRLTRNIFILYPFFQPLGQLKTLITDKLFLPFLASVGFAEALVAMIAVIWLVRRYQQKRLQNAATHQGTRTELPVNL